MSNVKPPVPLGNKYVEVVVDTEGETTIEAHGFAGEGCKQATRGVEVALGTITKRTPKRGAPVGARQAIGR